MKSRPPNEFRLTDDQARRLKLPVELASTDELGMNGMFFVPCGREMLRCMVSDGEEWTGIKNWESLYEISTLGRIRASHKFVELPHGARREHEECFISQEIMEKGYRRVSLCRNGEIHKILVHVLVAQAFISNPGNFPEINHRDGNKSNNTAPNLEWCSREYNSHHAIENGLRDGLTIMEIENIKELLIEGLSCSQIADKLGKARQTIGAIKAGRHRNLTPDEPSRYSGLPLWEHVSVSTRTRCPTWEEMCFVKNMFWNEDECTIQYHPAKEDYVNNHPFCLHIWKPTELTIPTPPKIFVGV